MIRLVVAALICITIFSIYYDLSNGTIPIITQEQTNTPAISAAEVTEQPSDIENTSNTYIDVEVKPGDTVLTIAERIANKPIPVSITQLIEDFQAMNEGITPEKIQIGKTYRFPMY